MTTYLLLGITYAFAAAVQPGPLQAYLISQTLANGWRRTLPAAFAPIVSDVPIIVLVLLVLTHVPRTVLNVLQIAGGLFVLYLAWGAFQTWRRYHERAQISAVSARRTLMQAALVNFLNPNPYIGWTLILGPLLLKAWREAPSHGVALVVAFYTTIVIATAGVVMLFAGASRFGPRVARTLVAISAVALGSFGLYEIWAGGMGLRG